MVSLENREIESGGENTVVSEVEELEEAIQEPLGLVDAIADER